MSFFQLLNSESLFFRKLYLELERLKCIEFHPIDDTEFRYTFNYPQNNPLLLKMIDQYRDAGHSALTATYTWMKALSNGPKVFKLDATKWESLEQYEINVPCEEYHQPYQTVIFDVPADYANNRLVPFEWHEVNNPINIAIFELRNEIAQGKFPESELEEKESALKHLFRKLKEMYGDELSPEFYKKARNEFVMLSEIDKHKPDFIICHLSDKKDWIMINIVMDSRQAITYVIKLVPGLTLEETWDKHNQTLNDFGVQMTPQEIDLSNKLIRAVFNANLLLCHFGAEKIGPASQSLYDQLQSRCNRKIKAKPEVIEQNRIALRTLPILYQFKQDVVLHLTETIKSRNGDSIPTGKIVRPHWRRGHYRKQHYGVGNILTKRIPILPVFVNADLFLGDKANTEVNYR
jgi:hypothetical protein